MLRVLFFCGQPWLPQLSASRLKRREEKWSEDERAVPDQSGLLAHQIWTWFLASIWRLPVTRISCRERHWIETEVTSAAQLCERECETDKVKVICSFCVSCIVPGSSFIALRRKWWKITRQQLMVVDWRSKEQGAVVGFNDLSVSKTPSWERPLASALHFVLGKICRHHRLDLHFRLLVLAALS